MSTAVEMNRRIECPLLGFLHHRLNCPTRQTQAPLWSNPIVPWDLGTVFLQLRLVRTPPPIPGTVFLRGAVHSTALEELGRPLGRRASSRKTVPVASSATYSGDSLSPRDSPVHGSGRAWAASRAKSEFEKDCPRDGCSVTAALRTRALGTVFPRGALRSLAKEELGPSLGRSEGRKKDCPRDGCSTESPGKGLSLASRPSLVVPPLPGHSSRVEPAALP